ncbi:serine acetyltransferase [Sphingomonas koreensis]|jgi:serine O-acetyltransferase|uniref:serine O-acetyltransferase n=1 Tax=Sphingomonas koreensis TaxID=93064 RepID=A0AAJ4S4J9_9SPHN|nr:serine O-acetyltransferase EpsC [Sphingomonas koreensis]MDC7810988.1 serine acetyltransferase [Sphingomonas koreensis]RSU22696.1 serine acetyltransferase [Sphingomonas koreensis]RSU27726.1 serine acetyltransferase [Sphingomonas koreensis]RSU29236.1 serine acetyltransferase [Sphingomonas koreensis]RSU33643.1 serine acetyltransferase [Sphingomonas koreensis]
MGRQQATAEIYPRNLERVVAGLRDARCEWRQGHDRHAEQGIEFPSRPVLARLLRELGTALFPLRLGPPELTASNENAWVEATLESTLSQLGAQIELELRIARPGISRIEEGYAVEHILTDFAESLPGIRRLLDEDVAAGYANDPAARSVDEVLLSYPSIAAIIHHRLAHRLHALGAPLVARVIAEVAHGETGIDIHPAARIGRSFFIDHGTGIVIGETAVIGDRVRIYQGVTLGGEPIPAGAAHRGDTRTRRHPRIGDDVVIFPGAVLLGPIDVGARSRIGGNVWLRDDVPEDSLVELPALRTRQLGD